MSALWKQSLYWLVMWFEHCRCLLKWLMWLKTLLGIECSVMWFKTLLGKECSVMWFKTLLGIECSVMWLKHPVVYLLWKHFLVLPMMSCATMLRSRIDSQAQSSYCIYADIWDWCWRTMADPFADGLIIVYRDARSARGGPFWGWPYHIYRDALRTAVQWPTEVRRS